jgi:hypothetical protein
MGKIAVMGLGLNSISHELTVLGIMGTVLFTLAVVVYRFKYEGNFGRNYGRNLEGDLK